VADPGGEGAQLGLAVVGLYGVEPGFQVLVAGSPGHHLGEASHMPGEGVDVRAAAADGGQLGLLV
jgi:hypothetical protein